MKKIVMGLALSVGIFLTAVCFAESGIPNLVGTWTVKADGAVLVKGAAPGAKTHQSGEFSALNAEAVVTRQQGRVLHGTFTSPRATENFIAVIGLDNQSFSYADEDGFMEGKIISKEKIQLVYRHTTPSDTVVGVGTWTRKR
jgi:hypothetical protein